MCSTWHRSVPTTGFTHADQVHPGWNVYLPIWPSPMLTSSTVVLSGRRTSSGALKSRCSIPGIVGLLVRPFGASTVRSRASPRLRPIGDSLRAPRGPIGPRGSDTGPGGVGRERGTSGHAGLCEDVRDVPFRSVLAHVQGRSDFLVRHAVDHEPNHLAL